MGESDAVAETLASADQILGAISVLRDQTFGELRVEGRQRDGGTAAGAAVAEAGVALVTAGAVGVALLPDSRWLQ